MKQIPSTVLEKKLPPFSGLALVALMLVTITWLTGNVVLFGTKAATGAVPQKVQVTNISDTAFTVTYQTDSPVLGSVRYGPTSSLGTLALDERDSTTNKAVEHHLHHIRVSNLSPSSKYIFEISSGDGTYKNNDAPYEVTTAPKLPTENATEQLVKGQVTLEDGAIPVEGMVEIATDTSQTLTALLKPDGSYEVPLKTLRSEDLSKWEPLFATSTLHVKVSNPTQQSTAEVLAGQANPAPLMVLSKNYDFSIDQATQTTQASDSAAPVVNLPVTVDTTQVTTPKITVPKPNQSFPDGQPKFEGKAIAGNDVAIIVELPQAPFEATVKADTNGNWQFKPEIPLDPGDYTITVKSLDSQGTLQTLTQNFKVLSEGSQFVEPSISPGLIISPAAALPSAPLPEPTLEDTPTPTLTMTPFPTAPTSSGSGTGDGKGDGNGNGNPPVPSSGSSAMILGFIGVLLSAGVGTFLFFFI